MKNVNRFPIRGNIGSVTTFEKGTKINIVTNRAWTDAKGPKKEVADWVQVTILDEKQAAWMTDNAKAGDVDLVEGPVSDNSYQKNGEMVYATDLIASTVNVLPKAQCRRRSWLRQRRSPASPSAPEGRSCFASPSFRYRRHKTSSPWRSRPIQLFAPSW
jgi:single-stranded DNA-binding protein